MRAPVDMSHNHSLQCTPNFQHDKSRSSYIIDQQEEDDYQVEVAV